MSLMKSTQNTLIQNSILNTFIEYSEVNTLKQSIVFTI